MDIKKRNGCFTSDGTDYIISGISPFNKISVLNYTQAAAKGSGVFFLYYKGMEDGGGVILTKSAGGNGTPPETLLDGALLADPVSAPLEMNVMVGTGFTIINTGEDSLGPEISITAISTASPPVATNSGTNNLVAGSTVQFFEVTGAPQIAGIPFTVGNNTLGGTTFSIDYLDKLATAATTAKARVLLRGKNSNPRVFFITKVEKGQTTKITLSETHNFTVGTEVNFMIDAAFGMQQLDGKTGCITEIDTDPKTGNTITVNIDSRNFSDFAFPKADNLKFTPAQVIPLGNCNSMSKGCCDFGGMKYGNQAAIGIVLKAGKNSPAGVKGDKIYWELSGNDLGCWGKEV